VNRQLWSGVGSSQAKFWALNNRLYLPLSLCGRYHWNDNNLGPTSLKEILI